MCIRSTHLFLSTDRRGGERSSVSSLEKCTDDTWRYSRCALRLLRLLDRKLTELYCQNNILIDSWGEAYICDFGHGRIAHNVQRTNASIQTGGSPRFVAPELTSAIVEHPTVTSDVYSLAMTIFTLGSGSLPWPSKNNLQAVAAAEQGERPDCPSAFCGLDTEYTAVLYSILSRMWVKDPTSRCQAEIVEREIMGLRSQPRSDNYNRTDELHQTSSPSTNGPGLDQAFSNYTWRDVQEGASLLHNCASSQRPRLVFMLLSTALVADSDYGDRFEHLKALFEAVSNVFPIWQGFWMWFDARPKWSSWGISALHADASSIELLIAAQIPRSSIVKMFKKVGAEGEQLMMAWDELKRQEFYKQSEDSMILG